MKQKGIASFYKDFLTLGVGTFLYMLVGVIGTPVITRLVDPVDYGQMSMLTVYSNFGLMACGLGLDQTMLRYFYRDELRYQRKLVTVCCGVPLLAALVIGVLLLLTVVAGATWFTMTELILLELNVAALLINRFATLVLRLRARTKTYSIVNIVQKGSYIVLTVALVLLIKAHHFEILAVATVVSTLLAALLAMMFERDIWRLPERGYRLPVGMGELLKYGFPLMLSSSITVVFNALDKLFIRHYCTLTDVGVYAGAMNLMAVFSIVRTSFNAIWMPAAVEHYERDPGDKTFFRQGNAFISVLMLLFGAGVVLCKDLFVMLLGSKYQAASMVVPYLMFEPILYTISETTATGIVVQKKSGYQLLVVGGACLGNFLGNWLLVPWIGVQGAALSTGLSYILFVALRTGFANKVFYVNYRLPRFYLLVAALFLFAAYGSNHRFSWQQAVAFLGIAATVLLAYRELIWEAVGPVLRGRRARKGLEHEEGSEKGQ